MKKTIYNKVALAALAFLVSSVSALAQNSLPERLYVYKGKVTAKDASSHDVNVTKVRYAKNLNRDKDSIVLEDNKTNIAIYERNGAQVGTQKWKKGTADYDSISIFKPKSTSPYADDLALDVLFLDGGDAIDLSTNNMWVERKGNPTCNYEDGNTKQNIYTTNDDQIVWSVNNPDHFRVHYTKGGAFEQDMADGHTLETIFCLKDDGFKSAVENMKWFCAQHGGAFGFLLYENTKGRNDLAYSVGDTKEKSGYVDVAIRPTEFYDDQSASWKVGTFYHLVGVFVPKDGETPGSLTLYIREVGDTRDPYIWNVSKYGDYRSPAVDPGSDLWIGVGGDMCEFAEYANFSGHFTVVRARAYSHPMTDEQVKYLMDNDRYKPASSGAE